MSQHELADSVYGAPPPRSIRLIPIDDAMRAAIVDDGAFRARHRADVASQLTLVRDVVEQTLALYARVGSVEPWLCYLAVDGARDAVVGSCGFTANPTTVGAVEIAYFTFPGGEGRGYATLMAGALVEVARRASSVRVLVANTLPERNASCRVLEKVGFRQVGEGHDSEVGVTWRWELAP